ncbi:MAG: AMP-binding protein [Lachnospiraceae bacterium]
MRFHNFEELLVERAGEQRDFLYCARTERTLDTVSFLKKVRDVRKRLQEMGIKQGERVLLLMDNSIEFAVDFMAVTCAKAIAVPVNTHLKWKEIEYIMEDCDACGMIADGRYRKELKIGAETDWVLLHQDVFLYKRHSQSELLPSEFAMILYTSGTTGYPKGVMLKYRNLLAKAEDITEAHQFTEKDCVLCVLPWFHINGLVITLITPIVSKQKIVISGKFSVSHFWNDVKQYGITWFSGVPTMYSHMLARGIPEDAKHSTLRFARSASSPLPVAVLQEFEEICHVPVIESYGITEGAAQITTNPLPPAVRKPGSVGIPFGNQIRIMDENGNELPNGNVGEVWISGANVTCGYYRKEEETKKSFTNHWFHSGDLGYLDEDGYLFLKGRIKELINRAGEKFSPIEVDEVLYQLPEVELAATVGVPDDVYGEKTAVFIKLKEGALLRKSQVVDWCRERLGSYKVPDMVFFVPDIPKGGNGKIQRLKLLTLYEEKIV